jgi:hypothetical protein
MAAGRPRTEGGRLHGERGWEPAADRHPRHPRVLRGCRGLDSLPARAICRLVQLQNRRMAIPGCRPGRRFGNGGDRPFSRARRRRRIWPADTEGTRSKVGVSGLPVACRVRRVRHILSFREPGRVRRGPGNGVAGPVRLEPSTGDTR